MPAMRVAVAGSSGLIGTGLQAALRDRGHEVLRLVRRPASGRGEVQWSPHSGALMPSTLVGVDAIVNLAGTGLADRRWTDERKRQIVESRTSTSRLLAETAAEAPVGGRPKVLLNGSAIGAYGYDGGDTACTERSERGTGFAAEVVEKWEAAAAPAAEAGLRVVFLRTGIVLSTAGGILAKQLLPFKLGLGGRLGSGQQYLSWISLADEVAAIIHLLEHDDVSGPVNLVAPEPVTNLEFTKAMGRALRRPTRLPIPTLPLRLLYGAELVRELLLGGQRVVPEVLEGSGFAWRHTNIDAALGSLL